MKKNYFFTISAILSIVSIGFSQITLNESDLLSVPDTMRMTQASITGVTDPTLTGTNYTWDYSMLTPSLQYVDTFFAVTSTPFVYQYYFNNGFMYPRYKANFAHRTPNVTALSQIQMVNNFNFYQNNMNTYSLVGFGSTINGIPLSIKYDSIEVIYRYPLNFGNVDSSLSKFLVAIPHLGSYGQTIKRVNEAQGWGTLITPFDTCSVLKIKSTIHITDTLYIDTIIHFGTKIPRPVSYEYKWLRQGGNVPMLEIDATGSTITKVVYRDSILRPIPQVGINEFAVGASNISVFPNPSTDQFNYGYELPLSGNVRLELLDLYGRSVKILVDEMQTAGKHSYTTDNKKMGLASGIYFARLRVNGSSVSVKVIVQ